MSTLFHIIASTTDCEAAVALFWGLGLILLIFFNINWKLKGIEGKSILYSI